MIFNRGKRTSAAATGPDNWEQTAQIAALNRSLAVIEFKADGTILTANPNFLAVVGYSLEEIVGKHHGMFVDPEYRASADYRRFWEKLAAGEFGKGQHKRIAKGGREAWLDASYNPLPDARGTVVKVIAFATDITAQKTQEQVNAALVKSLDAATARVIATDEDHNIVVDRSEALRTEEELEEVVAAVTGGDLAARIDPLGKNEFFGRLSQKINRLIDAFADVVGSVKTAAAEVARGVQEISQGNEDLSSRTEAQASSLEQTASSMEEMTASVRQNADNSGQANQLAVAARDQADKGGAVVAKAVKAMSEINQSSKKIADIIGVIDEIAFQTNLLALNAAVEAARAGEQGRGFAVVASEVRNLAGRSATAAKEIKSLIRDSVQKVDDGSTLVAQSGQTLEQIVHAVKKVSDIIAEIAASSQEQSSGIEQVNKAVMQLDEMTQQNAALVEQATAASRSMADQSQALMMVMAKFDTGGSAAAAPVARPAPARSKAVARAALRPAVRPQARAAVNASAAARPKKAVGADSDWTQF
jgi:methyl-accepting chemotaxis protein